MNVEEGKLVAVVGQVGKNNILLKVVKGNMIL